ISGPEFLHGRWRDFLLPASWLGVHVRDRRDVGALVAELSTVVSDGDVVDARAATAPLERAARWQRNALAIAAAILALAGLLAAPQPVARPLNGRPAPPVLAAIGLTPRAVAAAGVESAGPAIVAGIVGGIALAVALSPLLPLGVLRRADRDIGFHADAVTL